MAQICQYCHSKIEKHYRLRWCSQLCYNKYRRPTRRKEKNYSRTSTGKGIKWEKFAATILDATWQPTEKLTGSYDIIWGGKTIDVKSANLYHRKHRGKKLVDITKQIGQWRFDRGEIMDKKLDYFLCIGLRSDVPEKILLIPNSVFPKRGITITENGTKYDKYILRFNPSFL